MSKSSSKKRIIIAASLFAIFLIGAIVSVVVVLAAQTQNVQTNISIAYIVDGVGANVQSSYAIVPVSESEEITRTSMSSTEGDTISFGVSEQESTAEMKPTGDLYLDSTHQQIVFEYYFKSTSDAAFSIQLLDSPGKNSGDNIKEETSNMLETFYVSRNRLDVSDYRDKITDGELKPQALTELGQYVYIYVSAKVENENLNAYYNGMFTWQLSKQDTIIVNLDDGDTNRTPKVIPTSAVADINMPFTEVPEVSNLTQMFKGYYSGSAGSGELYVDMTGKGVHEADATTLYAYMQETFVVSGTTVTGLTTAGKAEEVLYIPNGVTALGDGTSPISTTATTIYVPNTVTTIAANAFAENTTIEYVNIEAPVETAAYADGEGITTIGQKAFYNCTNLKEITIPESVTTINTYVFYGCTALEKINYNATTCADFASSNYVFYNAGKSGNGITLNIGANVTKIPNYLCVPSGSSAYIPKIKTVNFEEGSVCKSIGNYAFWYCEEISSLDIPSGVTSIGNDAFRYCIKLARLTIPSSVTSIGSGAFTNCSNLVQVKNLSGKTLSGYTAPSYAEVITQDIDFSSTLKIENKYLIFTNGSEKVLIYTTDKTITTVNDMPSDLTKIGVEAFRGCKSLTSLTIPSNVNGIGKGAFSGVTSLVELNYNAKNVTSFPYSTDSYGWHSNIFYSVGSESSGLILNIGSEVEKLPNYFMGTAVIGTYFVPNNLKTINFANSSKLKTIGDSAFNRSSSLTSVSIPSSVTSIGNNVFHNCSSLTSIIVEEGNTIYNSGNGNNCIIETATNTLIQGCNTTVVPEGVTSIGEYAFYNFSSLTSIDIPSSVTSIGNRAFSGCSSLTSIDIPSSVTSIGNRAFSDCTALASVTFGNTSGWNIYSSTSSTATGYEINVETPATNATNLKNTASGTISETATNWGRYYLRRSDS